MRNMEWCIYTYKHRKAVQYVIEKYIREPALKVEMLARAWVHDMDKMLMYLFMDQLESQKRHVQTQPHHLEYQGERTYYDMVETVMDYESAPYTKPDKPLNAYDFTRKLIELGYLEGTGAEPLLQIMHELGIDHSYDVRESDPEGIAYIQSIGEITEEMLLLEILNYVNDNRDNVLPFITEHLEGQI